MKSKEFQFNLGKWTRRDAWAASDRLWQSTLQLSMPYINIMTLPEDIMPPSESDQISLENKFVFNLEPQKPVCALNLCSSQLEA